MSFAQLDVHKHENKANWKLANRFSAESLRPYLYSSSITPGWIGKSDRFWYMWRDSTGNKYWLVDPKKKSKVPLFDSGEMAAKITEANFKPIDATTLALTNLTFDEKDENLIRFSVDNVRYEYKLAERELKKATGPAPADPAGGTPPRPGGGRGGGGGQGGGQIGNRGDFRNYSPDRKAYVYAEEHNLFYVEVVDEKDSEPIQLTKDGEKDYSFGSRRDLEELQQQFGGQLQLTGQQSRETRVRAGVTWSKDSKKFYVTRGDSRKVKDLWLVNNLADPRPTLMTYKYAMPGDADVTLTELFTFDRDKKELSKMPIDLYKDQRLMDIHFQDADSGKLRFVRRDRLQRNMELDEMDLTSLKIKVLLTEKTENAFLETQGVRYLRPGGDFLWFSERTGWGHWYLYANDGKLKNAVTQGPWRCDAVTELDLDKNVAYVSGNGREPGENPYYRHMYRVGLDGKGLKLLNDGEADHTSVLSPTKSFFVDTYSRIDLPTKIALRESDGTVVMDLEEMDVRRLMEAGWQMPSPFVVKAADGVNDIYGNMWKPTDFDKDKKYPIIAYVYPGPQTESVTSTFSASASVQRLAQLGFIVVQIGNRGGNPARSNAYHSYGYYNLRDYGLADKKYGIEQLANRCPWIDLDRVGIYGHSGGGFMTAAALLLPPYNEFFKVGVSSSGNHDNNIYNQNWSEQHHGLKEVPVTQGQTQGAGTGRTVSPDPEVETTIDDWLARRIEQDSDPQFDTGAKQGQGTNQQQGAGQTKFDIHVPTNPEIATNLKGHLLLVTGDMDNNVHPANTIRLVNALIKANKRFDFMVMPGQPHGYGPMQPYFDQMTMEYFAEHLLGDYYRGSSEIAFKGGG